METQQIEKVHKHRGNQTMQHIKEPRLDSTGASRTRFGHTWCCDGLWLIELLRPGGCLQQFLSHMARVRLVARNCKTNIYGWYMDSTSNVPWVTNQQARPRVFFFLSAQRTSEVLSVNLSWPTTRKTTPHMETLIRFLLGLLHLDLKMSPEECID